jgi:hypothetical protein
LFIEADSEFEIATGLPISECLLLAFTLDLMERTAEGLMQRIRAMSSSCLPMSCNIK